MEKKEGNVTTIMGWVVKCYPKRGDGVCYFDVKDHNKGITISCCTELFLPLWEGDVVVGLAIFTGTAYRFDETPRVEFNTSEEEIIKYIIKSQKFVIRKEFAKQVYNSIMAKYESSNVDKVLTEISIRYVDEQDEDILDDLKICTSLSDIQCKKLLKWWYKTRVLRKLYLLGLNNYDIRTSKLKADELYEKCVIDPFFVVNISIDKCKKMYKIMGREYTEDDLFRAVLARKLYQNTIDKAWTGTPTDVLMNSLRGLSKAKITEHIEALKVHYGIFTERKTIYLKEQYEAEVAATEVICQGGSSPGILDEMGLTFSDVILEDYLTLKQKELVLTALKYKVSIGIGGAGSGKTTTLLSLINNLERLKVPYIILSYTGKAVARIKEVTKRSTPMTLHMAINKRKHIPPFKFAIFDESSMITTDLLHMFWKAFGVGYSMCFIGDINQLAPISCGYFFDQVLKCGVINPVKLDVNFRSRTTGDEKLNNILINAEKLIKYGLTEEVSSEDQHRLSESPERKEEYLPPFKFESGGNFHLLEGDETLVYEAVRSLANLGIKSTDITVITPYVKYLDDLNSNIQKIFRLGNKSYTDTKGITWAIGDRVMITQNNYSLNQMNGDEGVIIDITDDIGPSGHREMMVEFKSGHQFKFLITYEKRNSESFTDVGIEQYLTMNEPTVDILTHCYAISIHKSQGSEWDYVIFYYPKCNDLNNFVNRNLVYTATTRPRKGIWIIGDIKTLELRATIKPNYRHETLALRIKDEKDKMKALLLDR